MKFALWEGFLCGCIRRFLIIDLISYMWLFRFSILFYINFGKL